MTTIINTGNQDLIDNLVYPTISKFVRFIPAKVHPNQITAAGFCFASISAALIGFGEKPYTLVLAAVALFIYWLCDALDGIHARATQQTSNFGAFLDHFLDMGAATLLFFSVLVRFQSLTPLLVFIVIVRIALQGIFYLSMGLTDVLKIPTIGPSLETFIMIFALIFSALFGTTLVCFGFQVPMIYVVLLPYLLVIPWILRDIFQSTRKALSF